MSLYSYKGIKPEFAVGVFVAPSADIIGKVIFEENVNIWHQCVARGDVNWIRVGKNTNVQDLTMLHVTKDFALTIGCEVSIGHSVTLHGCTIGNNCLIGMGAVILDHAEIGDDSIVAAGSVVTKDKKFPARSLIQGVPAKVVRQLTDEEVGMLLASASNYVGDTKLYNQEFDLLFQDNDCDDEDCDEDH